MQDIFLKNFKDDINSVKEYIKHIDLINRIEFNNRSTSEESLIIFFEHMRDFGKDKKLFEYKSIIISLYGVLEKHIGIWIKEHIDVISEIASNYNELPEILRNNNFDLSVKLISIVREDKFVKFENLNSEELLTNLSHCINNASDYRLNSDAFLPLSGNLKHSKIADAFRSLDIQLVAKLKANKEFSLFLERKYGNNISNKGDDLFSTIDDLVIRRNEIAHGVNIDSILGITEFDFYIDFLEKYGEAIFETIVEKEYQYKANYSFKEIKNIRGVYKKGSILCFEIGDHIIKTGDHIIIKTPEGQFIKKDILEIQKDNVTYDELSIDEKVDIGIDLGKGITKKQTFYI